MHRDAKHGGTGFAPEQPSEQHVCAASDSAELEKRVKESLAQQASTTEILRVIRRSPTDVQPVFDTIAAAALRLCGGRSATVSTFDGELLRLAAMANVVPEEAAAFRTLFPRVPAGDTAIGRAILARGVIQIIDVLEERHYGLRSAALAGGFRSVVAVPLMRDETPIGAIGVGRPEPGPFSVDQVAMLETFAEQAVIAIENVRLFNETKEALEQQTATSEILSVISKSHTDVQPVFDTIAKAARELCRATSASVFTYHGGLVHVAAMVNLNPTYAETMRGFYPRPLSADTAVSRAIQSRSVSMIPDVLADHGYAAALGAHAIAGGFRSVLAVPLMREGEAIGSIAVGRAEPGSFPEVQVALLKTFADQAVIAIENVRLFNETKQALEQQRASGEVLTAISSSIADTQPVFETILTSCERLFSGKIAVIDLVAEDGMVHLGAYHGPRRDEIKRIYPHTLEPTSATGAAIARRAVVHYADWDEAPEFARSAFSVFGVKAAIGAPMMWEGKGIGVIWVVRDYSGPFLEKEIALLKTFADQAVIAIQNARLFAETQEALERQTATSDILGVISQSPTDVQPVFDAIAAAALKLCDANSAAVLTFDGELMRLGALANLSPEETDAVRLRYPMPPGRQTAGSRAILTGSTVVVPDVLEDPEFEVKARTFRSVVSVPLMREGDPIGAITVGRPEPGQFPEKQIALLRTFADQAVIAIENVRLFNETKEALEQQTATSEILRVISQSPRDVQPVFDTIAAAALKLCLATSAVVAMVDGDMVRLTASANVSEVTAQMMARRYPRKRGRDTATIRAIETRAVVAIPDVLADQEYDVVNAGQEFRSALAIPLLRDGESIGAIGIGRAEAGEYGDKEIALLQTFADQAAIAIENVRLFTELTQKNRELTQAHAQVSESLQRQTATSEILGVISQSPTDVQPVFDTIAAAAMKLCGANRAHVFTSDGQQIQVGAFASTNPVPDEEFRKHFPRRLGNDLTASRAILTGGVVVIPDVLDVAEYALKELAPAGGFRSVLAVPLLREGSPIGAIGVSRPEAGPFPDNQITLLQTFAAQAVIAIENVRLFNETKEALERQTATSEILRVISQSPRDVQPVFDTIVNCAMKLCSASWANVFTFDGEQIHLAASVNLNPSHAETVHAMFPRPPSRDMAVTRAIQDQSVVGIPDVLEDAEYAVQAQSVVGGFRSVLALPMMREGCPIGAISVGRPDPGPFPDKQIALLQTFADQAVIAIENVRLFKELESRNRDLTEALEHQTATSEVLRVISSSPSDVQPVFDIIGERAAKMCDAHVSVVSRIEGELIHLAAVAGMTEEGAKALRQLYPLSLNDGSATARAVRARSIVHIEDVLSDPHYDKKEASRAAGWRNALAVPMIREGQVIGTIFVAHRNPGFFAESKIELLKTFADQGVIAIENVRLFKETKEALEQQTATSEILRVISQSPRDVQPVFDTIAAAALKLCGASSATVVRFDGELVHIVALASGMKPEEAAIRRLYPRPPSRDTVASRAILTRSVANIPDVLDDLEYGMQDVARSAGYRSAVGVPLMLHGKPIGAFGVARPQVGPFPEQQVALLQTFADQAVIAIENVRLFTELEARTLQLTRSVEELKALGEVGQAVSSTLDLETVLRTIVSRATHLAGMDGGSIWEYDEAQEQFHLHATDQHPDELVAVLGTAPVPKGEGAIGRLALTGEPVEVRDITEEGSYQSRVREILIRLGSRSLLAVPLLREDRLLGGLVVNRKRAGEFAPEVVELLKTFATQSALAIQNARLYREIEVKSRELELASRHKSEFLANMSHELRTPLNAIIGFSEVLSERLFGEINEKQTEYISDILQSGQHLLSLINDILDLSKIEAGRMELELSDFNLPSTIEQTVVLVRERALRRGITLGRMVDERLGPIRGDERKVKQVLLNLLSNALKFTPEGGKIDVRAAVNDGVVEISVTDTGIGISPEDQEAVFEEFRQVGTASKKVEGTGLGLAISRKFIELHGGKIWVKSTVGSGSTFAFTLPLR